jgi:hypothetical protein
MKGYFQPTTVGNMTRCHDGGYVCREDYEALRVALAERKAVAEVPLSSLVCVGRAKFPRTGGNAGISWYVEDALADTGGFRSGSPCNGELLFVLPTTAKRAMLAASQQEQP